MKKILFSFLIGILLLNPIIIKAEETESTKVIISQSQTTQGDAEYSVDGKEWQKLSAPLYKDNNGNEAFCIQSEKGGAGKGREYSCTPVGTNDIYAAAATAGVTGGYSQQEIEYALKMISSSGFDSNGVVVSSHSGADSNGVPIYSVLGKAGDQALNGTTVTLDKFGNYDVQVRDPEGTYAKAAALAESYLNGGFDASTGTSAGPNKKVTCSGSNCTATITYPAGTKITASEAVGGTVTVNSDGSVTISGIPMKENKCATSTVTVNYEGATSWLRCTTNSTEMQEMYVRQPSSGTKTMTITNCDGGGTNSCPLDSTGVSGCVAEAWIKEPTDFKSCIFDQTDCLGVNYNIIENQFCKVACKENIKMKFPTQAIAPHGSDSIFSGRYFTLNRATTITGTRICGATGSTSDEIDWEHFLTLIYGSPSTSGKGGWNEEYRDAHNEWALASKLLEDLKNPKSNSTETCCHGGVNEDCSIEDNREGLCDRYDDCLTTTKVNVTYYKTGSYRFGDSSGGNITAKNFAGTCTNMTADYNEVVGALTATQTNAQNAKDSAEKNIEQAFEDIKECNEYKVEYSMTPDVTFTYNEGYPVDYACNNIGGGGKDEYGVGPGTGEDYQVSGGSATHYDANVYECFGVVTCTNERSDYYYENNSVRKEKSDGIQCDNQSNFYTMVPSGVITTQAGIKNTIQIGNVFPVSISTKEGVYEYNIEVTNLGMNGKFDDPRCNAGIGNKLVCPYTVINDVETPCVYPCTEPEPTFCSDPPCKNKGNDGKGGINYFYRPIVLQDVFPNSETDANHKNLFTHRTVGSNWVSAKGQDTQEQIEKLGENVYLMKDSKGNDVKNNGGDTLQYSYTITPRQMANIREYNDAQEKNLSGGYADFTLKCDGNGLNCVSSFLNGLAEGGNGICKGNGCFTDNINDDPTIRNVHFETWNGQSAWK